MKNLTKETIAEIKKLRASGKKITDIAKYLGLKSATVKNHCPVINPTKPKEKEIRHSDILDYSIHGHAYSF